MKYIQEENYKWIWGILLILFAVLSYTLIHDAYLDWSFTDFAIAYLDNKADTMLGLTGASTSASVAITMIPGDIGTPIASQLANISSYSILILAAIHLEKYLITLAAELGFRFLIPISLVLASFNLMFFNKNAISQLTKKICTVSIALILAVPASVYASTMIEKTYQDDINVSIQETQQNAEAIKEQLDGKDQTIIEKFVSTLDGGSREIINRFEHSLNNFVEAISVMIITACAIPIATFMLLLWLIKSFLQVDFTMPSFIGIPKFPRMERKPKETEATNNE